MYSILGTNGLVHWDEKQILLRERFIEAFSFEIRNQLLKLNRAWDIRRVEGPLLNPRSILSSNYTSEDIWVQQTMNVTDVELALRPETTPSTYAWMVHLLESQRGYSLPMCVWQSGKSFRREQDQVTKNVRLKEFYQMEFQCAYTADTANDYLSKMLDPLCSMLGSAVNLPSRIVESDRLPSYSKRTMDIEVYNGNKWMEICSISLRTDFPIQFSYANKKGEILRKDILVLEIAIGLDRCVYNRELSDNTPYGFYLTEEE